MPDADPRLRGLTIGRALHSPHTALVREAAGDEQLLPVFLHSGFRTGSTWLWQKLRSAPTTIAYSEVFHEILTTLTPSRARHICHSAWDSRHPVASPYFIEYMPLVRPQGGVAGFEPSMAYESSIPMAGPDGELRPAETAYVEGLISAAQAQKRVPVLSCTRSLGRARALRRAIGGRTILLHRNLLHQWASYSAQAEGGNPYFMQALLHLVTAPGHDPFLRSLCEWFDLAGTEPSEEVLFQVFFILQLYHLGIAFDTADLVVDVAAIATDTSERAQVERALSAMIRHDVDLSDVEQRCEPVSLVASSVPVVRDTIEQFAKLIPAVSMSADCVAFLERAKNTALSDWERFDVVNRRIRSVVSRQVEDANARLLAHAAESDQLRAEKDRLAGELSDTAQALTAERTANADATRHREAEAAWLRDGLAAAEAARSDLAATLAGLSAQGEVLRAEGEALRAEGEGLRAQSEARRAEGEALRADRDGQAARVAQAEAELQELRGRLDAVSADLAVALAGLASRDASPYRRAWRRLVRSAEA